MRYSADHRDFATEVYTEYALETDARWNAMLDEIEEHTGLDSEDVYLLVQSVQYKALYPERTVHRRGSAR